jgi:hypothetical protein
MDAFRKVCSAAGCLTRAQLFDTSQSCWPAQLQVLLSLMIHKS